MFKWSQIRGPKRTRAMPQNAGVNSGGADKTRNKSADSKCKSDTEAVRGMEARPLDSGIGADSRARGSIKGRQGWDIQAALWASR